MLEQKSETCREALRCRIAGAGDGRKCSLERKTGKKSAHDTLVITKKHIPAKVSVEYLVSPNFLLENLPNGTTSSDQVLNPQRFFPLSSETNRQDGKRRSKGLHVAETSKE
jgi:hypothetical protein